MVPTPEILDTTVIGQLKDEIIVLKEKTDFLSVISVFYFANLAINIVFAFVQKQKFYHNTVFLMIKSM